MVVRDGVKDERTASWRETRTCCEIKRGYRELTATSEPPREASSSFVSLSLSISHSTQLIGT